MKKSFSSMEVKYHIVIFGCQMNKSDSERVHTVIRQMGYVWTEREEEADLLGVLACSVRQKSIDRVYSRINKWNRWKDHKNLLTFISGCMLPADRTRFLKLFDLVFSIAELPDLSSMIRQYGVVTPLAYARDLPLPAGKTKVQAGVKPVALKTTSPLPLTTGTKMTGIQISETKTADERSDEAKVEGGRRGETKGLGIRSFDEKDVDERILSMKVADERIRDFWKLTPYYISDYEAYVPIQNGCDKFCAFCAVPYTRGREISRSSGEILAEIRFLVDGGYKMITLLGQNVNSYGLDMDGREMSFPDLLRDIGEFGKKSDREFWVYFTSPHPADMTDEVLEVIASYDCLAKQIHLPMQSGDDDILRRMNRKYDMAGYEQVIRSIRKQLPSATLFTDIIVGFCGENREQFEQTRKAMERIRFNMAYVAAYSPRPGAASARWEDNISTAEKKERLHILTEELMQHSLEYNKRLVGTTVRVIVTGEDRKAGYLAGLTEGRIVVRFPSDGPRNTGSFVWLNVTGAAALSVEGTIVGDKESVTSEQ